MARRPADISISIQRHGCHPVCGCPVTLRLGWDLLHTCSHYAGVRIDRSHGRGPITGWSSMRERCCCVRLSSFAEDYLSYNRPTVQFTQFTEGHANLTPRVCEIRRRRVLDSTPQFGTVLQYNHAHAVTQSKIMRKLLVQKIFRRAEFFAAAAAPLDCGWRRRLSSAAEGSSRACPGPPLPRPDYNVNLKSCRPVRSTCRRQTCSTRTRDSDSSPTRVQFFRDSDLDSDSTVKDSTTSLVEGGNLLDKKQFLMF
jgi:hypothetical protein